ncbi:velvet factor protein [Aspergillus nomiae NRRL 13137]|uniref:Velvet factor protein n=1 Tax=Aspergillus nomiae NRRL (strain ATCC 15546 / NRRL 13137 / CBS 260.88 / M93) TaxID=1509407 RepID=A0A0L1J5A2_ASPN3|nr:velvet factor protein [Aspergillus nomiae NRRL 13137]KNG86865.1 velvet factor protein [Aspergillus nomiae NRRL 13137]
MSNTPLPQWTHSLPDTRYPDTGTRVGDGAGRGLAATIPNPAYSTPEPPRFLFPDSQGYDPTASTSTHPRFVFEGARRDSVEHRYSVSSTASGPLAPYAVQRLSISKSVDYYGPSSSYHETSSQGRGSIGSTGRTNDMESLCSSTTFPSPVHSDKSSAMFNTNPTPKYSLQQPPRQTTSGVPLGFENLLHHSPSPPPRRPSTASRYHLHIRQQPMAARACGFGDRDRRPVDPPPIIQLLLTDFDPVSDQDKDILQDPRFAVGCLLFPAATPPQQGPPDRERGGTIRESRLGSTASPGQSTPLLSGKAFISPFYVDADPDPATAPAHPTSEDYVTQRTSTGPVRMKQPAAFFIFSDLSIHAAGEYRLQFRLMNWGHVEDTGQPMPILAEAWSEPFRVFPAKDFPGMQDSSPLAEGLKELGFTELKTRGKGKGKGRKR